MGELVRNLPSRQQRSAKNLEEDTVVAVLNTIHEIITDSSENARSLIQTQGIQKLVAISKSRWGTAESKTRKNSLPTGKCHYGQQLWPCESIRASQPFRAFNFRTVNVYTVKTVITFNRFTWLKKEVDRVVTSAALRSVVSLSVCV